MSGITSYSPSISVSRKTGRMLFTTFYDQGNEIRGFDAAQTIGHAGDAARSSPRARSFRRRR